MNAEIDITNTILRTKRLVLRPWRQSDLADLFEYASVDGVGQMAGWAPHKSLAESQVILERFIQGKKTFAIVHQSKVIGSVGIEEYRSESFPEFSHLRCREIGYILAKPYWGQGLMPEAVKEVIHYLFEKVNLDVIFCGHYDWNMQSARVQAKCGFKYYRTLNYTNRLGVNVNGIINILTKDDYLHNK